MAGFDLEQLMRNASALQAQVKQAQEALAKKEVEGSAGGGLVTARATGSGELLRVKIDPAVVTRDDVGMLEDLVTAAVNDALRRGRELAQAEMMPALASGIPGLPGFGGTQ